MIEVNFNKAITPNDAMMMFTQLMAWLCEEIKKQDKQISGYLCLLNTDDDSVSSLVLCDDKIKQEILNLLLEPPGEFKDKYIASCPSVEPIPVVPIPDEELIPIEEDGDDVVDEEDMGKLEKDESGGES